MYKAIAFDISKRTLICLSFLFYFLAYAENVSEPLSRYYGEKLVYHISWLGISAGEAVLKTNVVLYHGKRVLRFMGSVRSALWFEKIYYVEDTVYTYVDPVTLAPFEIAVDFREGKDFRKKNNYIFDSKNKTVTVGNSGKPALHVPEDVMEMFGAFFTIICDGDKDYLDVCRSCKNNSKERQGRRRSCFVQKRKICTSRRT